MDGRAVGKNVASDRIPIALQFLLSGIEERSIALFQNRLTGVARELSVDVRDVNGTSDARQVLQTFGVDHHTNRATRFGWRTDDNHPRAADTGIVQRLKVQRKHLFRQWCGFIVVDAAARQGWRDALPPRIVCDAASPSEIATESLICNSLPRVREMPDMLRFRDAEG